MGKYTNLIQRIPVYWMGGQSNMDGRGYYPTNPQGQNGTPSAKYQVFGTNQDMQIFWRPTYDTAENNGEWQNFDLYVNNCNVVVAYKEYYGGSDILLKELADYKGQKVAMIKCTRGGTDLYADWKSPSGLAYVNAINQTKDALNKICQQGVPELKILSFYQGYSDCDNQTHADAYNANLTQLMGEIEDTISEFINYTPKWHITESPNWGAVATRPQTPNDTVRAVQNSIGTTGNNLLTDNSGISFWVDNIHLTGATYEAQGLRWFNLLKDL